MRAATAQLARRCGPGCDTRGATQSLEPRRASLIERALGTASVAELAVLALVICGTAWLALALASRFSR